MDIVRTEGWVALGRKVVRRGKFPGNAPLIDERYRMWLEKNDPTLESLAKKERSIQDFSYKPALSAVVVGRRGSSSSCALESLEAQIYEGCEILSWTEESERSLDNLLAECKGEFVALVDAEADLRPDAFFEIARLLNQDQNLDFIYSDHDTLNNGRRENPFFKPDWSPDLLTSINYVYGFAVYSKRVLDGVTKLGPIFEDDPSYDLALRVSEVTERMAHLPIPLYSLPPARLGEEPLRFESGKKALEAAMQRRGQPAEVKRGLVPGSFRVQFEIRNTPPVSIVIPTRDRLDLLRRCVDSIRLKSSYRNYQVVVVDNQSRDPETLEYLRSFGGQIISFPHEFNYAQMMNVAAREAEGDFLLFLNNDTEVISPGWIEALLEYGQRRDVGAVGARLMFPDGTVQHEGVLVGLGGSPAVNVNHHGYLGLGECVRNFSAVTAACMLVLREVFWAVGGFDENLKMSYNDVDLCLRLREKEYLIVYTPYAQLIHDERGSRGSVESTSAVESTDVQLFKSRWGKQTFDPYYNPNLDTTHLFTLRPTRRSNIGPAPPNE